MMSVKVAFVMSVMDDDDRDHLADYDKLKNLKLVLERNLNVSCRMNFCLTGAG